MAIKHIVTGGFGNGTFSTDVGLVTLRGYGAASSALFTGQPDNGWRSSYSQTTWRTKDTPTTWRTSDEPEAWRSK